MSAILQHFHRRPAKRNLSDYGGGSIFLKEKEKKASFKGGMRHLVSCLLNI